MNRNNRFAIHAFTLALVTLLISNAYPALPSQKKGAAASKQKKSQKGRARKKNQKKVTTKKTQSTRSEIQVPTKIQTPKPTQTPSQTNIFQQKTDSFFTKKPTPPQSTSQTPEQKSVTSQPRSRLRMKKRDQKPARKVGQRTIATKKKSPTNQGSTPTKKTKSKKKINT